jgi:hypothetical protein
LDLAIQGSYYFLVLFSSCVRRTENRTNLVTKFMEKQNGVKR